VLSSARLRHTCRRFGAEVPRFRHAKGRNSSDGDRGTINLSERQFSERRRSHGRAQRGGRFRLLWRSVGCFTTNYGGCCRGSTWHFCRWERGHPRIWTGPDREQVLDPPRVAAAAGTKISAIRLPPVEKKPLLPPPALGVQPGQTARNCRSRPSWTARDAADQVVGGAGARIHHRWYSRMVPAFNRNEVVPQLAAKLSPPLPRGVGLPILPARSVPTFLHGGRGATSRSGPIGAVRRS